MAILLLMLNAFLRSFFVYAVCPEIKWWCSSKHLQMVDRDLGKKYLVKHISS
jgi:hypothetical protein